METKYRLNWERSPQFELRAREIVDSVISGVHGSSWHGFSLEFTDRRNYVPGDDLRQIDYKAYARTDRLEIKRFESEANRQTHLLLDCSGSMNCRFDNHFEYFTKFEYGCFLAAIFAHLSVRQRDAVGLTLFGTKTQLAIPPKSSDAHFRYIVQQLEQFEPQSDEATNLETALDFYAERLKKRSLIVVLSDLYCDSNAVLRRLKILRKKHEIIVFHLFDRSELEFPFDKTTEFRDEETGAKILLEPNRIRGAYLEELKRFIDDYRKNCYGNGIEYYQVDTSIPLKKLFADFLTHRVK